MDDASFSSLPRFAGVYAIRNCLTGAMYVGSTCHLRVRWPAHRGALKSGRHTTKALQAAWNKDGEQNFELVLIEAVEESPEPYPRYRMEVAEVRWLRHFREAGVVLYNRYPIPPSVRVVYWDNAAHA